MKCDLHHLTFSTLGDLETRRIFIFLKIIDRKVNQLSFSEVLNVDSIHCGTTSWALPYRSKSAC